MRKDSTPNVPHSPIHKVRRYVYVKKGQKNLEHFPFFLPTYSRVLLGSISSFLTKNFLLLTFSSPK